MIYNLDINNRAFLAIKEERKKVEIRVTKINGFDYSNIKKNDIIKFKSYDNEKINCLVLDNIWYPSIEELLTKEGTKYTLSSTDDFDEGVKSIKSFKGYEEGMKLNGVHAIKIEPIKKILLSDLYCVDTNINLDEYLKYTKIVKDSMQHPDWLGDFTKSDLEYLISTGSKIWVYYLDNEFVCSMMFMPADSKSLDKMNIKYDYKIVSEYGPIMVNPKYVGNGLQYQMLEQLDKYSKENNYEYSISTIHPDNSYCINNFLKDNFNYTMTKEFKRGTRNIYLKKI